jgi:hypothetical protein
MQSLSDGSISGVKFCSPCIGIDSIPYLIIAALVEAAEIKPDLRYVWIDSDST